MGGKEADGVVQTYKVEKGDGDTAKEDGKTGPLVEHQSQTCSCRKTGAGGGIESRIWRGSLEGGQRSSATYMGERPLRGGHELRLDPDGHLNHSARRAPELVRRRRPCCP